MFAIKIIKRIKNVFTLNKKNLRTDEQIHSDKLEIISLQLKNKKNRLTSLLPSAFREKFNELSYIAGGCIYSIYNDQAPKDYDFFLNKEFPIDEFRECFMGKAGYHGNGISGGTYDGLPLIITDNAVSIGKFNIVTKWNGSPKEVISEFDFLHNMNYWNNCTEGVQTLSDFKYLRSNELKYNSKRARDIVGTIIRVTRFTQRGMKIKSKEVSKMLLKLYEVGFNERELEILKNASSDKHFGSN